jgi:AraC-like DNA-binding protein
LLDLILVQVLRQWHERDNTSEWPEVTHPGIAAALREIHKNPHRQWTVGRLSEIAGMPRTAFSKLFTTVVGQPPMSYLTGWRLSRAARLLRETNASLASIAPQVGIRPNSPSRPPSAGCTACRRDGSAVLRSPDPRRRYAGRRRRSLTGRRTGLWMTSALA